MKKFIKIALALSISLSILAAEEGAGQADRKVLDKKAEEIDPSDAGKPISFLSAGVTQFSKNPETGGAGGTGVNLTAAVAGDMSSSAKYMVLLESQTKPDELAINYYRARWFNVFTTGSDAIPRVGYSVDYFGNSTMDSFSLGGLMQIGLGVEHVRLFWNIAYNYSQQNIKTSPTTSQKENLNGMYTNLFFNAILSQNFSYMMIIPEYQYNKSSNTKTDGFRLTTSFGAPITDNKQLWIATSYVYQYGKMNYNIGNQGNTTNPYSNIENRISYVNFNLTWYFM